MYCGLIDDPFKPDEHVSGRKLKGRMDDHLHLLDQPPYTGMSSDRATAEMVVLAAQIEPRRSQSRSSASDRDSRVDAQLGSAARSPTFRNALARWTFKLHQ